jgi:hypothetical protein
MALVIVCAACLSYFLAMSAFPSTDAVDTFRLQAAYLRRALRRRVFEDAAV